MADSGVKRVPLDKLHFDPDNARLHPDDSLSALCASLTEFGQPEAIVVRQADNVVIAGNGRLEAMRKLGWKDCHVRYVDWDERKCRAYSVVANRTGEMSTWDTDRLESQLDDIKVDFDLNGLGFDEASLDDLFGEDRGDAGDVVEDEVPEPPTSPTSTLGTLWTLGRHRLLCGDSTDEGAVRRVMGGRQACAVLTDPPYGVSYVGKTADALVIQNDGKENLRPLLAAALGHAKRATAPGAVWYVAAPAGPQFLDFAVVLSDLGIWRQTLAWVKDAMVMGHSDFHYKHEAIFYGWTPGGDHVRPADRKQVSVWDIDRPKRSKEHPTMKPVELYARMLEHSTRDGDLVYEPFGGSGTTLIACEQMDRVCCAIELDPAYADVIVQRWENLTGKKAEMEIADAGTPAQAVAAAGKRGR